MQVGRNLPVRLEQALKQLVVASSQLGREKWIGACILTVSEFLINDVSTIQFEVF